MFEVAGKKFYKVKDLYEGNSYSPQWWSKMLKRYSIQFHEVKDHGVKNISELDYNFLRRLHPQSQSDNKKRIGRQPPALWKVSVKCGSKYYVKACSLTEAEAVDIVSTLQTVGIECRYSTMIKQKNESGSNFSLMLTYLEPLT